MTVAERHREQYELRKAAGLCTECGAPSAPERIHCAPCAARMNGNRRRYKNKVRRKRKMHVYQKAMRERRKAAGLCPTCGNAPITGRVLCLKCLNRIRASNRCLRALRQEEANEGDSCSRCGGPKEPDRYRQCEGCRALSRGRDRSEERKARNEDRRAAGLCIQCGLENDRGGRRCSLCQRAANRAQAERRKEAGNQCFHPG